MTAKEMQREAAAYLSRYKWAKEEVKDIERRIERVRSEMMGVRGISYEGGDMPHAQFQTGDLSDYVARIDDLLQDWKAAQSRAIETMREISSVVESVGHDRARRVLMLYYVDEKTYPEIQKLIPCSNGACFKWRRIGLIEVYKNKLESSV